ncbi:hypothetical protein PG984_003656 [Apiospora sp. TS-2023a]
MAAVNDAGENVTVRASSRLIDLSGWLGNKVGTTKNWFKDAGSKTKASATKGSVVLKVALSPQGDGSHVINLGYSGYKEDHNNWAARGSLNTAGGIDILDVT